MMKISDVVVGDAPSLRVLPGVDERQSVTAVTTVYSATTPCSNGGDGDLDGAIDNKDLTHDPVQEIGDD
jgi:hypothetical protein